jgi:hypothetical protein
MQPHTIPNIRLLSPYRHTAPLHFNIPLPGKNIVHLHRHRKASLYSDGLTFEETLFPSLIILYDQFYPFTKFSLRILYCLHLKFALQDELFRILQFQALYLEYIKSEYHEKRHT